MHMCANTHRYACKCMRISCPRAMRARWLCKYVCACTCMHIALACALQYHARNIRCMFRAARVRWSTLDISNPPKTMFLQSHAICYEWCPCMGRRWIFLVCIYIYIYMYIGSLRHRK